MPAVRIYAFAKELGLDNKQLLELCDKAGVKGKGSALASLEEDEVSAVKAFMSSGAVETATAEEDPAPLRPPAKSIDTRVPEIKTAAAAPVQEAPVEEEVVEAPAEEEVVEPVAEAPVEEPPAPAPVEEAPAPEPEPVEESPKKGVASKVGGLLDRLRGATKKTAAKK